MERDWNYFKERFGEVGARDKFEDACHTILSAKFPKENLQTVKVSQGDGGIDVFSGEYSISSLRVFQCKFFLGQIDSGQKQQIRDSFKTVVESDKFETSEWTLCIPKKELNREEHTWWAKWKDSQKSGIKIHLLTGKELIDWAKETNTYNQLFNIEDSLKIDEIHKSVVSQEINHDEVVNKYLQKIIDDTKKQTINQVYVELLGEENVNEMGDILGEEIFLSDWNDSDDDFEKEEIPKPRRIDTILNIAADTPRFLLTGEAGTGKSTTLSKILYKNSQEKLANIGANKIPVLIQASEFSNEYNLKTLIEKQFPNAEFFLKRGEIRLLIDGLNEVNKDYQKAAHNELKGLLRDYQEAELIISARDFGLSSTFGLPIFDLQPLKDPQIQDLIDKRLPPVKAQKLWGKLSKNDSLKKLATNPLLLQMVLVAEIKEYSFENKGQLFETFLDAIFKREWSDRINIETNKDVLAYLAYHSRKDGYYRQIPKQKAKKWIKEYLKENPENISAITLYENFCYSAIFNEKDEQLEWFHESYGEYFSALYLKNQWVIDEDIEVDIELEYWFEPLLMTIDIIKETKQEFYNKYLNNLNILHRRVSKQYQKALDLIEKALDIYDNDLSFLTEYIYCLRKLKRYDDAIEFIEKKEETFKKNQGVGEIHIPSKNELGICYKLKGDYTKAIEIFEEILKHGIENIQSKTELGICYKLKGDYTKAIEIFEEIQDIAPDNIHSKNELGFCYKLRCEYEKAINFFEKIFEEDNTRIQAKIDAAICYRLAENYGKAINVFKEILVIKPENIQSKNEMGICYSRNKEYKKAIEVFEEIIKNDENNIYAINSLAISYRKLGNTQMSIEILKKAISRFPENQHFPKELGISQYYQSRKEENRLGIVINSFGNHIIVFAIEEKFYHSIESESNNIYPLFSPIIFSLDKIIKNITLEAIPRQYFVKNCINKVIQEKREGFISNSKNDYFFSFDSCNFEPKYGDYVSFIPAFNNSERHKGRLIAILISKIELICKIVKIRDKLSYYVIELKDSSLNQKKIIEQKKEKLQYIHNYKGIVKEGQKFVYEKKNGTWVLVKLIIP